MKPKVDGVAVNLRYEDSAMNRHSLNKAEIEVIPSLDEDSETSKCLFSVLSKVK